LTILYSSCHNHNQRETQKQEMVMSEMEKPMCPKCGTKDYVVLNNTGEKLGTGVGVVAGAALGWSGASGGATLGATLGSVVPFVGTIVGATAGAIAGGVLGALSGATAGGVTGNLAGEQVDKANKLFRCNKCSSEMPG
jgi:hypothetical protein